MKKLPELSKNWLQDENIRESRLRDNHPVVFHCEDNFNHFKWECYDKLMRTETMSILVDELYITAVGMSN